MRRIALGLVFGLLATAAHAQGWQRLPNGTLGYQTDYTSSGFFWCNNYFLPRGACSVNGNSATLTNNGATLTLTYTGYSNTIVASSQHQRILIGEVTKTFSGTGPFIFPKTGSPNAPYLGFGIIVTETAPQPSAGLWWGGFMRHGQTLQSFSSAYSSVTLGLTPPPAPAKYGALYFSKFGRPLLDLDDPDPIIFEANAAVTPEPATLILVGSGLAGVFGALARRRRKNV